MLDGINEFAEHESQQRWIIRRCVVSVLLLAGSYVGSWIPVEYYLNTRNSPAIAQAKPVITAYYRPLNILLRRPNGVRWTHGYLSRYTDYWVRLADDGCRWIDKQVTRWAAAGYPISAWWVAAGLLGIVIAYAISPVAIVWWIKFLGIGKVALIVRLYEWYCAPIDWLTDHSATARSFYEEYTELFALTN